MLSLLLVEVPNGALLACLEKVFVEALVSGWYEPGPTLGLVVGAYLLLNVSSLGISLITKDIIKF